MRKKKLIRTLSATLAAILMVSNPLSVIAGTWQFDGQHWKNVEQSGEVNRGWYSEGVDDWYYLDEDGKMVTGWFGDYHLHEISDGTMGKMDYGWYFDGSHWYFLNTIHDGTFGARVKGWKWIDGYSYYFDAEGKLLTETVTPDGYTVDSNGRWHIDGKVVFTAGKGMSSNHTHEKFEEDVEDTDTSDNTTPPSKPEETSPMVVRAKENVIALDSTTEEGLEELRNVYEGIYDYWTDDNGTPEDPSDDGFQFVVGEDNPLYQYILDGTYVKDSVIYIPACEYFPTGVSLVYQEHNDEYDRAMEYDASAYEVIYTRKAYITDLFEEDISFTFDDFSEEQPVSFVWVPDYSNVEDGEEENTATFAFSRNGEIAAYGLASRSGTSTTTGKEAVKKEADLGAAKTVKGKGFQTQNLTKLYPQVDYSDIGQMGVKIDFDKIVLYDHDGKGSTETDRVVVDGELAMKNMALDGAFDWDFKLSDMLPQHIMGKFSYTEVRDLKVTLGGDLGDLEDVCKTIRKGISNLEGTNVTHNNRRSVFGMDITGVDMSNTIVIGAVGFNLGTKTFKVNIKNIRDQSIKVPMAPTLVAMILMNMDGSISTTVVGQYTYTSYVEKGFNVQKQGYIGTHGSTCAENVGQENYVVSGDRNLNIYDLQAKSATEKNKKPVSEISLTMDGSAEVKVGFGVGASFMFAGIMPAMITGTVGPEADATLNGKIKYSTETGVDFEGEASVNAALVARAAADVNLTAETFAGTPGITGHWDLAEYTLLQFSLTSGKLSGVVMETDFDHDAENNEKLENADVVLKRKHTGSSNSKLFETKTDENGEFELAGVADGTYVLTISKEGYKSYEEEIELDANNDALTIYLDRDQEEASLSGVVSEADDDSDSSNNLKLEGVKVTIEKINSSTQKSAVDYTGEDGSYQFEELTPGLYAIRFECDGFIRIENEVVIPSGGTYYNAMMEAISNDYAGMGIAKGTIINALNAAPVGSGIQLKVRKGVNQATGDLVTTTQTNQNGSYTLELPAGNYTVYLQDIQETKEFMDDSFVIKVMGGFTIDNQNGEMTPILQDEEIRIVLTWGSKPSDLDSHLVGPNGSGDNFHVYYSNQKSGGAHLDVDDTTSFGPETTTIYEMNSGIYRYAVHNYTNRYSNQSKSLAESGAYVRVYRGDSLVVESFHVPSGEGTVWNVFEFDSESGQIIPINTLEYVADPRQVGMVSSYAIRAGRYDTELELKDYEVEALEDAAKDTSDKAKPSNASPSNASPSNASSSNAEYYFKATSSNAA